MTKKYKMEWEIKIRKVENGFICTWKEESENEDNLILNKQVVFETKEENIKDVNLDEYKNMQNVLNFIKEHFGINYSKHNQSNLIIKIEKNED